MAIHPRSINHLAIATRDIKSQIEFFTDVLGCQLKALFWFHGLEGAWHGFIELSPDNYIAFVEHSDNPDKRETGLTHAGTPLGNVAAGAMQHFSMQVDSLEELLVLRDRIRRRGIMVLGPIDHSFCHSIYFAGPEGLVLELMAGVPLDPQAWIDPEVAALAGIDEHDLARYANPTHEERSPQPVPQPALDRSKPHFDFPDEMYAALSMATDEQISEMFSESEPPVKQNG